MLTLNFLRGPYYSDRLLSLDILLTETVVDEGVILESLLVQLFLRSVDLDRRAVKITVDEALLIILDV